MDRISKQIEEASRRKQDGARLVPKARIANVPEVVDIDLASMATQVSFDPAVMKANAICAAGRETGVESYRMLRTRVLQTMQKNDWRTVGVTSPNPRAGKTTTAVNLSLAVARDPNHRCVLLDCDFRRPSAHNVLGLAPELGLVDYICDERTGEDMLTAEELLLVDEAGEWLFLPCGRSVESPTELLNSSKMRTLLRSIVRQDQRNMVIVDLPPILVGDDVIAMSAELDALLIVVEDGVTDERELQRSLELLQGVGIVGFVLNKSRTSSESYAYGDDS